MKGLLFTYALTYGGALVSIFNPFYGLLIYFCFAIIKPPAMWHWSVPAGNYSRIVAIALLIGWALQGFGNWDFRGAKPVVYAILAYFGWLILSALFAANQSLAWASVEAHFKIVLPFLVGATLLESARQLKQLAWVLMLSQAYVAFELNLSYYEGFNRLVRSGFAGMDNNSASIAMVAGAGLAFFLGLGENIWWRRWLAFGSAALMAHVPMFAMSRGGMLGLIVTGVVAFILLPKQPKHYAVFGLAVIVGLSLAGPQVIDRFSTVFLDAQERDASADSRLEYWGYCWEIMQDEPILGVGPDNFRLAATRRHPEAVRGSSGLVQEGHSLWLQTGAETGFPGLGLLLAFYGLASWHCWQLIRRSEDILPWLTDSARMVIAGLAGFAISVSFVSLELLELPYYIVLVGAGVLKLADQEVPESTEAATDWSEMADLPEMVPQH